MSNYVLLVIVGIVIGIWFCAQQRKDDFYGEYDRAKYEWKLNKEKEKQNSNMKDN